MDEKMREFKTDDLEEILNEVRQFEMEDDPALEAMLPEELEKLLEEVPAQEPETEQERAEEKTPAEENTGGMDDTIRLDDLREVIAMTAAREDAPEGNQSVSDETVRLGGIAQAVLQEAAGEARNVQKPEVVDLDEDGEEFITMPIIFRPKQRLRELKRKLVAGPEKRYYELVEQGVGKLQVAMLVCLIVIGVCAAAAVFYGMDMIPENRMRLMVFGQVLAMLLGALMGCQQLIEGVSDLFRGKFTMNTMLFVTFLACCADSVLCLQELRVPICAAFTLEVFMALWNTYHRRTTEMGQMDTMRKAIRLDSLIRRDDYYEGKPAFVRGEGQVEDFTDYYDKTPGPEKVQNVFALLCLLLSIGIAVLAGLRHGISMGVQIFSTSLLVAVPASFFVALSRPFAILERRLHRLGTVLCGWKGIKGLKGRCGFPLTDVDLFPNGAAKMNGVKFYGERDPETVITYAAALMQVNGGSLAPIFNQLLVSRNGVRYEAKNVRFYGNGGIGGEVCDEPVLMGTLEFLKTMGVEIPEGVMVKQAVYVSIDGELSGLFAVTYARTKFTLKGVAAICGYRKITPIIMAEDFMLTAPFLKEKFGIRTRRVVFPDRELRKELMAKQAPEDGQALALMTQEGLAPVACAITGARALRTAWRVGLVIHILGGILGLLIMAALAITGSVELLTPMNILLYQLIWMVPGLLATFLARTI